MNFNTNMKIPSKLLFSFTIMMVFIGLIGYNLSVQDLSQLSGNLKSMLNQFKV